jgi:hypothetical protein
MAEYSLQVYPVKCIHLKSTIIVHKKGKIAPSYEKTKNMAEYSRRAYPVNWIHSKGFNFNFNFNFKF